MPQKKKAIPKMRKIKPFKLLQEIVARRIRYAERMGKKAGTRLNPTWVTEADMKTFIRAGERRGELSPPKMKPAKPKKTKKRAKKHNMSLVDGLLRCPILEDKNG